MDQEEGACSPHFCSAIYNAMKVLPKEFKGVPWVTYAAKPLGGTLESFIIIMYVTLFAKFSLE